MGCGEEELLRDQCGPAKMNPFAVVAKESNAGDPRPESDRIELRMVLSSRDKVGVCNLVFSANNFSWRKNLPDSGISSRCHEGVTGVYLQVCKYRLIFKRTCSRKYCQIQCSYACFTFRYEVLKLLSISIINLRILEASSELKNIYGLVKKG